MSGTIIRGTLIQGLNRPQKRKTQLSNRAHSSYHLVGLYSHTEPRLTVFLRSEGEGLLDGDPGEEEATNDDNSVVALHPDTMELLQLFHSTPDPLQVPKEAQYILGSCPSFTVRPIRGPLEPVE